MDASSAGLLASTAAAIALFMGTIKTLFPSLTGQQVLVGVLVICAAVTGLAWETESIKGTLLQAALWGSGLFQATIGSRELVQFTARQATGSNLDVRNMRGP